MFGKSISLDEVRSSLEPKKTVSSLKYLLDLQKKALSGKWQSPFSEYINKFGRVKDNGNTYIGTPDKMAPEYTEKIIGRKIDAYDKRCLQLFVAPCTPAMESNTLYRNALKLIEKDEHFFHPEKILKTDVKELETIIQHHLGSRHPESVALAWQACCENLDQFFDMDPKNIFYDGMRPENAHETICALLKEYGLKTAALLIKEYVESGVYRPGRFRKYIPIPADIHVMRFVIKSSSSNPKKTAKILHGHTQGIMSKRIQQYLSEIIPDSGMDPIKIDDAVWIYAREVCSPLFGGCTSQCPNLPHHHHLTVRYSKDEKVRSMSKRDGKLEVSAKPWLTTLDKYTAQD